MRYHSNPGAAWFGSNEIDVRLRAEAYCEEDPNTDFLPLGYPGSDLAAAQILNTTSPPTLVLAAVSGGQFGGFFRVIVRATQNNPAPASFQAYLSIGLSVKA